jgi:hypothetical protein
MKYLLPLAILFVVAASCKKKDHTATSSYSESKGDFLILVVSDSLECAMEYREDLSPTTSLKASPVYAMAEFNSSTQNYDASIYAYGVGVSGVYSIIMPGAFNAVDFPKFSEYYEDTFIDSIPGNQLKENAVYNVLLDTSKIDLVLTPYYEDEIEDAWDKIKNLRIVFEYRKKYPDSRIGFLHIKKQNGEAKSYFFMNKYKP